MEFTTTGLSIDNEATVFNKLASDISLKMTPYLNGTTLKTDESSVIGRIIRSVSKPIAENNEILPNILKQFDLNQVEGNGLDYLAEVAFRNYRKDIALANGFIIAVADSGTVIPINSVVSNSVTGDNFNTRETVSFDGNDVAGIVFSVNTVKDEYTINYSVTGLISQSPQIYVKRVNETTTAEMAQRIVNSVNSQSTMISATLNNDNTVSIVLNQQLYHADFGLSEGLSLTQSYKVIQILAQSYNTVQAEPNTLTVKKTAIKGWRSLYNPVSILKSTGVENDGDFKDRLQLGLGTKFGTWDGVYARLFAVRGVSFVNIKTNTSKNTVGGVTNNGIAISVLGGSDDEVALAIFESVAGGIGTVGTTDIVVKDLMLAEHTISFSRPEVIKIILRMQITQYKNFPTNGKQLIKQAIVDYFNTLETGESVQYSRLYTPINTVAGFSVNNMSIGILGEDLSQDNIYMSYNQIPQLSADNIFIGGS